MLVVGAAVTFVLDRMAEESADAMPVPIFDSVTTLVTLTRWRDRDTTEPYFRRPIASSVATTTEPIHDEAIQTTSILVRSGTTKRWELENKTSGNITFHPIAPPPQVDVDMIDAVRADGEDLTVIYDITEDTRQIVYTVNRYNAFQRGNEDFAIAISDVPTRSATIRVDFSSVLHEAAFMTLPQAHILRNDDVVRDVAIHPQLFGRAWLAEASDLEDGTNLRLRVFWNLMDAFPDAPLYVFGYDSLMHPEGIRRTIPDHSFRFANVKLARLSGYRRRWSAFSSLASDPADSVAYQAFWNIEPDPDSSTFGVLLPVSDSELRQLDIRERHYVRVEVTGAIDQMDTSQMPLPLGSRIFTYVSFAPMSRQEYIQKTMISADYERLAVEAAREYGDVFISDVSVATDETRAWPRR